jgi:HAMP domain-containing protein
VTRPLRTIAILVAMGLLALAALSVMAGRLRTRAASSRPTATREVVPPTPDGPARP